MAPPLHSGYSTRPGAAAASGGGSGGSGEDNVQANWNETNSGNDAFIRNKPDTITTAQSSKLAAVEAGATADQTGAEIKAAYEGEADTNAFTDADHTKLDSLETDVLGVREEEIGSYVVADSHLHFINTTFQGWADANWLLVREDSTAATSDWEVSGAWHQIAVEDLLSLPPAASNDGPLTSGTHKNAIAIHLNPESMETAKVGRTSDNRLLYAFSHAHTSPATIQFKALTYAAGGSGGTAYVAGEGIDISAANVVSAEDASTTNKGIVELATRAEAEAGSRDDVVVTPADAQYTHRNFFQAVALANNIATFTQKDGNTQTLDLSALANHTDDFTAAAIAGNTLTLTRRDGTEVDLTLPSASGGASAFTGLTDTPAALGAAGYVLAVNAAGNALEFVEPTAAEATPDASTTVKGKIEIATEAEVAAKTDTTRAITPRTLADAISSEVPIASTSARGKIEIATQDEATAGVHQEAAVTPETLKGVLGNRGHIPDNSITEIKTTFIRNQHGANAEFAGVTIELDTTDSSVATIGLAARHAGAAGNAFIASFFHDTNEPGDVEVSFDGANLDISIDSELTEVTTAAIVNAINRANIDVIASIVRGGSLTLTNLETGSQTFSGGVDDTDIEPTDGQVLTWNNARRLFENRDASGGSGSGSLEIDGLLFGAIDGEAALAATPSTSASPLTMINNLVIPLAYPSDVVSPEINKLELDLWLDLRALSTTNSGDFFSGGISNPTTVDWINRARFTCTITDGTDTHTIFQHKKPLVRWVLNTPTPVVISLGTHILDEELASGDWTLSLVFDPDPAQQFNYGADSKLLYIAKYFGGGTYAGGGGGTAYTAGEGINISDANILSGEDASATNKGIVELATNAETTTGTDTTRAVTPAGVAAALSAGGGTSYSAGEGIDISGSNVVSGEDATTTNKGIIRLATTTERDAGSNVPAAMTPADVAAYVTANGSGGADGGTSGGLSTTPVGAQVLFTYSATNPTAPHLQATPTTYNASGWQNLGIWNSVIPAAVAGQSLWTATTFVGSPAQGYPAVNFAVVQTFGEQFVEYSETNDAVSGHHPAVAADNFIRWREGAGTWSPWLPFKVQSPISWTHHLTVNHGWHTQPFQWNFYANQLRLDDITDVRIDMGIYHDITDEFLEPRTSIIIPADQLVALNNTGTATVGSGGAVYEAGKTLMVAMSPVHGGIWLMDDGGWASADYPVGQGQAFQMRLERANGVTSGRVIQQFKVLQRRSNTQTRVSFYSR